MGIYDEEKREYSARNTRRSVPYAGHVPQRVMSPDKLRANIAEAAAILQVIARPDVLTLMRNLFSNPVCPKKPGVDLIATGILVVNGLAVVDELGDGGALALSPRGHNLYLSVRGLIE